MLEGTDHMAPTRDMREGGAPECEKCGLEMCDSWTLRGEVLCLGCAAELAHEVLDGSLTDAHQAEQAAEILRVWIEDRLSEAKRKQSTPTTRSES